MAYQGDKAEDSPRAAPECAVADHRNEEGAVVDFVSDLLIPRVRAPQLALIEKDAGRAQRLANPLGRLRILGGVAQVCRVRGLSHRQDPPGRGLLIAW